jgi:hypothetical protein
MSSGICPWAASPAIRARAASAPAEPGRQDRVPGEPERPDQVAEQVLRAGDKRSEQLAVRPLVRRERGRGLLDRPGLDRGRPVVERVGERQWRVNPLESVLGERQLAEERRRDRHRVDG